MARIRDLLARDLSRTIEEIVQVNQTDERSVYEEITEYVVTERISDQYRQLLDAIAGGPSDPQEGIGVWISGFFGSGKSSFAKNLGYALENPPVLGHPAAELFKERFRDERVKALVNSINARIPVELIMFDVSKERSVRRATERMAEIMYTVVLRELGYAEDFDIANLEITLEGEGRLAEFEARCREIYGRDWRIVRKGAEKISQASAVLHALDPSTYPSADSWAHFGAKTDDITVARFVERAFDLCERRRPGRALLFIVDEVGQYIGYSGDKIEDLRAVVEKFGEEGKNRLRARRIVAPAWVVVTSQEKLDEVVAAIDSKRVELAKLQDRFKYHIDLAPADIREVAARRVLSKTDAGDADLRGLFRAHQGQLNSSCRLERTSRPSEVGEDAFVRFYPYLPHYVDLSIDIVSGIRLQPGAPRQLGGSNRTIIRQAYEMLVNDRTAMAERAVGDLVTLDKVFELVEGNVSSEKRADIFQIAERFRHLDAVPEDAGWALRVAKVICLLEFVRDLPRTPANIAALLVEAVDQGRPQAQVEAALERLRAAQFVRETEEGYKLQTAEEKNWETEKRAIDPKPRDRNEIKRQALREIFSEPRLRVYQYQNLRGFRLGISVDDVAAGEAGDVTLSLRVAEDPGELEAAIDAGVDASRQQAHQHDLYWVLTLIPEIDELIAAVFASQQMVAKYDLLRAQNRITNEEAALLSAEKSEGLRLQQRLKERLETAVLAGAGIFRGVSRDGAGLGRSAADAVRAFLQLAIPDLYPKLGMGVRQLSGNEADEILRAANLNALSQVFYGTEQGLNLVVRDGNRSVPNLEAEVAREVLGFLRSEHAYGNKITGKTLDEHFGGVGYGWDRDVLRLVLAVLLRAGAIEVTYQGRRFRSHQDPQCRVPLTNNTAFRTASFAPRETVDLRTLTAAVERFEELTGGEVDVEEAAIATALKRHAEGETRLLLPLEAAARANGLPVVDEIGEYKANLETIQGADSDDCVRILAGEGRSLKAAQDRAHRIGRALDAEGLRALREARTAVEAMWPVLEPRSEDGGPAAAAGALAALLSSDGLYDDLSTVERLSAEVSGAYRTLYELRHGARHEAFQAALEEIRSRPEWGAVADELRPGLVAPLSGRACEPEPHLDRALTCTICGATVPQMESDRMALPAIQSQAIARLHVLTAPEERVERVRLADFLSGPIDAEDSIDSLLDAAVEQLREHLHKLVAEGARVVLE